MRVGARRALTLQPYDLARMPTGQVLTLSSKPLETQFLDVYGPTLEPVHRVEVRNDVLGLILDGAHAWLLDRFGLSAYDAQGVWVRRVPVPVPEGMRLGGFTIFDGDFLVALEHDDAHAGARPGALMRLRQSGEPRWTTALPAGVGSLEMRSWSRENWVCSYFRAGRLTISDDALLVAFAETPRSGIGMGYVVALDR